jgi:hypothetical protein
MAYARVTDPQTSHDAAKSVDNITATQHVILSLLRTPMCDLELLTAYRLSVEVGIAPYASESGIRSRRSELVDAGLVIHSGDYKLSPSGRKMMVWVKR